MDKVDEIYFHVHNPISREDYFRFSSEQIDKISSEIREALIPIIISFENKYDFKMFISEINIFKKKK